MIPYKILLLSGEGVQVVSLAKNFKNLGCNVTAICDSKLSSGYCTRWLDKRFIGPSMIKDKDLYKTFFYDHISTYKYDAIIPTADESAEFLSREKERIENEYGVKCAIPSLDIYLKASNKSNLMDLCRKINVGHPYTHKINSENINEATEYVGFPALIKPDFSAGARGITKVYNMADIEKNLPYLIDTYGSCSIQQLILQPDYYYNVMIYRDSNGKITGWTIIKIRRYFPLGGGTSCYSETIENPKLLSQCVKVLEALDWHGFADFDVLQDINTREYKIIEINPRVPSSLQASFAAGMDFAECYVKDLFGGKVTNFSYAPGKQVRWFGLDVMWFLMSPKRFSFKPSWFKFFGKDVSYHDGAWNDPLPMIAGCLEGLKKYLNPDFRKAKLKNNE